MVLAIGMEKRAFKLIDTALKRGFVFFCVPKSSTPNTSDRPARWFSYYSFTPAFWDVFLFPSGRSVKQTFETDIELAVMTAADNADREFVFVSETPHVVAIRTLNELGPIRSIVPPLLWATMANQVHEPPSFPEFFYHIFFIRKGSIGSI
jgi:hypothetical protein